MSFFSKNIKHLRETTGLSQAQLGKILGVTRDNIASYERGSFPKLDLVLKIVNYFHIDIRDLIEKDLSTSNSKNELNVVSEEKTTYERLPYSESITVESLQKLVRIQEKYIKSLEENIEAFKKSPPQSNY